MGKQIIITRNPGNPKQQEQLLRTNYGIVLPPRSVRSVQCRVHPRESDSSDFEAGEGPRSQCQVCHLQGIQRHCAIGWKD